MEKVKHFIFQHQDKLKYGLLLGAGIGALNCIARADYNLILYLYIYYIWNILETKVNFHIPLFRKLKHQKKRVHILYSSTV